MRYDDFSKRHLMTELSAANKLSADLESFVVNTLFGSLDNEKSNKAAQPEDRNKMLANFTSLAIDDGDGSTVFLAHESLERYLRQWAFLLETDKVLSTPITSSTQPLRRQENKTLSENQNTINSDCIRIMFVPPPRFLNYKEQRNLEKGVLPDRKGAKLDSKSPGGIQLLVETIFSENNQYELVLTATRCGIDDDTIIKVSSERTIIRRLNDAIRIWKKVRAM